MATVRQILDAKRHQEIHSIGPESSTYQALQMMAEFDIGAIAVVGEDKELLGLLTEREYARRIVLEGKKSRNTPVRETMRTELFSVTPETTLDECMERLSRHHLRYLPVKEGNAFIGIVSIGDVIKTLLALQQSDLEHMERYISGGHYA